MNIALVNRSDLLGGAAIATTRLMHGLNEAGANARMLVMDKRSDDDRVTRVGSWFEQRYNFLAERLGIFTHNGFSRNTLFQIDTATHGSDICNHPWVQNADVIVLGWINQGMLSLKSIEKLLGLGKPIVWVMHDMWNCTGICHHAGKCTSFETYCHSCPLTGTTGEDISTSTQEHKRRLYEHGGIHFVAVSHWLEQKCRYSSLMSDADISVIANPFPTAQFMPTLEKQNSWGIDSSKHIAVMGAARLDDPMKGLDVLIETSRFIANEMPDLARQLHLVLYGNLRDTTLLRQLQLPFTYLGYVTDLRSVYQHAHIVISTSQVESFGYTLVEGMACGCTPVTTGDGGQTDIVKHLQNGYITDSHAPKDIAQGLLWAVNNPLDRESQHQWVEKHFDQGVIAKQHLNLYKSLI
ncbi:MAG: glycosyltransferase [Muribaculaceae bacterium]|nr:glycosyltransferase [Muribaculaceae bacterium]